MVSRVNPYGNMGDGILSALGAGNQVLKANGEQCSGRARRDGGNRATIPDRHRAGNRPKAFGVV
jgi:hypothetical protein